MLDSLKAKGFQVEFLSHALAILSVDFPAALVELEEALLATTIPSRRSLPAGVARPKAHSACGRLLPPRVGEDHLCGREKNQRVPRESQSHEVDHVRSFENGATIALEIEWNNKDPFYDRDLENYKRLNADGAISVGIIVTRGKSLQDNMRDLVRRFLDDRNLDKLDDLRAWGYDPTSNSAAFINKQTTRKTNPLSFGEAFTNRFVADKFGEATTHWRKLEDRVHRGVGNPCPLVLIGLTDTIVTFHEGMMALVEVEAAEAVDDTNGTDGQ